MAIPLIILAILSLVGGLIGLPEVLHAPHLLADFLQPVLQPGELMSQFAKTSHKITHQDEWLVMGVSIAISLAGIGAAWFTYLSGKAVPSEQPAGNPVGRLFEGKFFMDEIYQFLIVTPFQFVASIFSVLVDLLMINLLVEGLASLSRLGGGLVRLSQNGRVSAYALSMLVCLLMFALMFIF
jgi:NADH-quinone oxidoreductase subunit L